MTKLIDTDDLLQVARSANATFAPKTHFHNASNISSGTLEAARLPKATTSAIGAVKVGAGLNITSDGTLSITPVITEQSIIIPSTASGSNYSNYDVISAFPDDWTGINSDSRRPYVIGSYWSSGTRQNWMNCYGLFAGNEGSEWVVYTRFCNMHVSNAASGTLQVYLLWI